MEPALDRLCVTCGYVGPCDENHVAARANDAETTVTQCRGPGRCQHRFTRVQWDLGILRREPGENIPPGTVERWWATCQGLFALLTMFRGHCPQCDAAMAAACADAARGWGVAFTVLAEAQGEEVAFGPNPVKNRLHRAGKRTRREHAPTPALLADPGAEQARAAALLRLGAQVARTL